MISIERFFLAFLEAGGALMGEAGEFRAAMMGAGAGAGVLKREGERT